MDMNRLLLQLFDVDGSAISEVRRFEMYEPKQITLYRPAGVKIRILSKCLCKYNKSTTSLDRVVSFNREKYTIHCFLSDTSACIKITFLAHNRNVLNGDFFRTLSTDNNYVCGPSNNLDLMIKTSLPLHIVSSYCAKCISDILPVFISSFC